MWHSVHLTHPMPHWGASPTPTQPAADAPAIEAPSPAPAADAPNERGTQPSPAPRYEAPLRFGGACQGIFPALTSTPEPSAQSNFGVPHATKAGNVAARRRADHRQQPTSTTRPPLLPLRVLPHPLRITNPRSLIHRNRVLMPEPLRRVEAPNTPAGPFPVMSDKHHSGVSHRGRRLDIRLHPTTRSSPFLQVTGIARAPGAARSRARAASAAAAQRVEDPHFDHLSSGESPDFIIPGFVCGRCRSTALARLGRNADRRSDKMAVVARAVIPGAAATEAPPLSLPRSY